MTKKMEDLNFFVNQEINVEKKVRIKPIKCDEKNAYENFDLPENTNNVFYKRKKMQKTKNINLKMFPEKMGIAADEEVFMSDQLPKYAKSYILPKVMKKKSVESRLHKDGEETRNEPKPEDKSLEAFKFSMLKASLDYESGFTGTAKISTKSKLRSRGKKFSTGSSIDRSEDISGRSSALSFRSIPVSHKRMRKLSSKSGSLNCSGPGTIDQYVKYVKSGGFVPLPILEPERAVEASMFALYPGLDSLDDESVFNPTQLSIPKIKTAKPTVNIQSIIQQQFQQIKERFGEPSQIVILEEETEEDSPEMQLPAAPSESGYSTLLETSSVEEAPNDFSSLVKGDKSRNSMVQMDKKPQKNTNTNLLGMMEEPKESFNQARGEMAGSDALDLFIDPISIFGSERHPALVAVLQQLDESKRHRAEKLQLQEELFMLKAARRNLESQKEVLLNKAVQLQNRAHKFKAKLDKLADIWVQKLDEELNKTGPLESVLAALHEELEVQNQRRYEALEKKMRPIVIKDGPSRKANYKITAGRLHCEIYALTQRHQLTKIRVEQEQNRREKSEREVQHLRHLISEKRTTISTVTKGVPFSKLEVRPSEQWPQFTGPIDEGNPLLLGMPNATLMASARLSSRSPMMESSQFSLPQSQAIYSKVSQTRNCYEPPSSDYVPPNVTTGRGSSSSSSVSISAGDSILQENPIDEVELD